MAHAVLIVEDHLAARDFLTQVVTKAFKGPIHVHHAPDLDIARRMLQLPDPYRSKRSTAASATEETNYQLILIDLHLPDGDGQQLLIQLKDYPATKVVTTSCCTDESITRAMQAGADGYLLKEDRFEVLVQALQDCKRGQPPISAKVSRRLLSFLRPERHEDPEPLSHQLGMEPSELVPRGRGSLLDHEKLTPRETEVLTFISKGYTVKGAANLMKLRWSTVNDYVKSVYRKLNVSSRAEAAVVASKLGLL